MAVRTRFKLELSVSSTSNEEKDICFYRLENFSDVFGEGLSWKTTIPVLTTDLALTLPNFTQAKFLFIKTSSVDPTLTPVDIIIKRNLNTNEAIIISPIGPTSTTPKEGVLLLTTSGLTALHVTNSSATTAMILTIAVAGD